MKEVMCPHCHCFVKADLEECPNCHEFLHMEVWELDLRGMNDE